MNISHYTGDGNRASLFADHCNSLNAYELPKPHISRISDDDQSSSEFYYRHINHPKTITVLMALFGRV